MNTAYHPGMNARNRSIAAGFIAALLVIATGSDSHAATITKSATGTDLASGASWGGTAPGSGDIATWTSTSSVSCQSPRPVASEASSHKPPNNHSS